jgi:hypothetical protein
MAMAVDMSHLCRISGTSLQQLPKEFPSEGRDGPSLPTRALAISLLSCIAHADAHGQTTIFQSLT